MVCGGKNSFLNYRRGVFTCQCGSTFTSLYYIQDGIVHAESVRCPICGGGAVTLENPPKIRPLIISERDKKPYDPNWGYELDSI
jgi:hypothetical protein